MLLFLIVIFFLLFITRGVNVSINNETPESRLGGVDSSVMALLAVLMKADGNMTKAELEPIKRFLRSNYTEHDAVNLLQILKYYLEEVDNMDIRPYCLTINRSVSYREKIVLLDLMFEIAYATDSLSDDEVIVIKQYSKYCSIQTVDFNHVSRKYAGPNNQWRNDYRANGKQRSNWNNNSSSRSQNPELDEAYKTLGISPKATDDEVKSAFRTLAKKTHPDRMNGKSEKEKEIAEEQFRKINEAYKTVAAYRGIK